METTASKPVDPAKSRRSKFGKVGLDVGLFGRWSRLIFGIAILVPFAFGADQSLRGSDSLLRFYVLAGVFVVGIAAAYVAVYWALGERIFARANPWFNTAVFVGPAFVVAWWEVLFGPLTGLDLYSALSFGAAAYIGLSFVLQWKLRYGGCEVVALPILISKRRYTTYCIPLVALDAVEKAVVDRFDSAHQGAD